MSEARKNMFEIEAAWMGFAGSTLTLIVGFFMGLFAGSFSLSLITGFPGSIGEFESYFLNEGGLGIGIADTLLRMLPLIYWVTFIIGALGLLISIYRTKIGIRFSGLLMFFTAIISLFCLFGGVGLLSGLQIMIQSFIVNPQELATYGISVPHALFWPAIVLAGLWFFGSFLMLAAAPMNEAKYRTKRMKVLARADTAERAGKPREAINLYSLSGDISMKLREEDKASEYYAKSREIREVSIQAVLEAEEKQKREELAARRGKLEEQRREILMRADKAEEKEDWARAAVIYKEAASLSVDLGEKKLAAQFTAKAKELQKKAKKARKARKEPPPEE